MRTQFAKILIVDGTQVLCYVQPNEDDPAVTIHNVFEVADDVFVDMKVTGVLKTDDYGDALDAMSQEKAEELVREMRAAVADSGVGPLAVDES